MIIKIWAFEGNLYTRLCKVQGVDFAMKSAIEDNPKKTGLWL